MGSFRFAVAATFTAEPLQPVFEFWSARLETPFETVFAPYHQVLQTLLDPASAFGRNVTGFNAALVRCEDLARGESQLREILDAVRSRAAELPSPLLFALCAGAPSEAARLVQQVLDETPNVSILLPETLNRQYPVAAPGNPAGERLGHIPYTDLYFAALGTALVRQAHARSRSPLKVIALDCDNTLWSGICGEDGPAGVALDPPRRALQEFMLAQREAGIVLVLASKNNEADVLETFERHPEFPLSLSHFADWRINWEPKTANLSSLAASLNLGLDSFVFVDDNPRECAEVRESLAGVLAITLPAETALIPRFLSHVWAFDHTTSTEEDRLRSTYYQRAQEFGRAAKQAKSIEEFYHTLELRLDIRPLGSSTTARAAQLTQRTNQFNFTTIRRTEGELQALASSGRYHVHTVNVADRFGDYGLTGLVILEEAGDVLAVDTFLLSCRVLGRGVEHQLLRWLGETAARQGHREVRVVVRFTTKNTPAQEFLAGVGSRWREDTSTGFVAHFPVFELEQLDLQPEGPSQPSAKPVKQAPSEPKRRPPYAAIALELSRPEDILRAVRAERRAGASALNGRKAQSDTERALAEIWCELLHRPSVALEDNFFDVGGHSLLAVLLLVRIKEQFGVELPVDDVYSGQLTLERLAHVVEARHMGGPTQEEVDALVAEIAGLTDEEAAALLAREGEVL